MGSFPPVVDPDQTLTFDEDVTPPGITAPVDPQARILATIAVVMLNATKGALLPGDGATPIAAGQALSASDLALLAFKPLADGTFFTAMPRMACSESEPEKEMESE